MLCSNLAAKAKFQMKSLNTVLSVVLLIAVIFLFYREFSSKPAKNAEQTEAEAIASKDFSNLRIAYINYDSLVVRYEYHKELKEKLEKEAKALEAELARRSTIFQEDVAILQQRANELSQERLQSAQMELQQKQQELMMYRDQQTQRLAEQEQELTSLLRDDLDDVLKKIREEYNLDIIFSSDSRSDLLAADENLNVTESVLSRLNDKYKASKGDTLQKAE